ncbi:urease accessory protein UreD [Mesorhizobium sp. CC13]|uniref:urease accessory protein UreD n=1 Tax=Mesorhizobium sp. CC13 TaxID=3029194 RepID=UPI003265CA5D
MTSHWAQPSRHDAWPQPPKAGTRGGRFDLAFTRHGTRTHIGRQFVSYPFHMTRPFTLDAAIPSLLTVYQQSSSGGLYRDDRLESRYELGAGTAAHVTTQAATVVHDCHGQPARQANEIVLDEGAFLALAPDPLVLFPGASCSNILQARLASGAVLFLSDAFDCHDPQGIGRPFDRLRSDIVICDAKGRLVVRDSLEVTGSDLAGPASPIGGWHVVSSFMFLGDASRLPDARTLEAVKQPAAAILGVSALADGSGWGVRCLSADATAALAVAECLFALAVQAAFGHQPAPRRK